MSIITVGIDLAKNVFAVHGVNDNGKAALVKPKVARDKLLELVAQLPPCVIGMEACSGAHHWARLFRQHGHTVKLMAPKFVSPYRMSGSAARTMRRTPPPSAKPSPGPTCASSRSRKNTSRSS
jgi:transposase